MTGIWLQFGAGDDAELVRDTSPAPEPPERVSRWRRISSRLRPHRLLCNALTGHYLCRRYWRRQPLTVTSEWRKWGGGEDGPGVTIHQSPPQGGLMPCCDLTPFEVPRTDRMTLDPALVTCGALPPASGAAASASPGGA